MERSYRDNENSDVCLILIEASEGMNAQDLNILSLAERNRKGIVILVNKWDLMKKETDSVKEFTEKIRKKTAPFTDVPIVFTSVTEKQRILKALELALMVNKNRTRKITTSKLNKTKQEVIRRYQPPALNGKNI